MLREFADTRLYCSFYYWEATKLNEKGTLHREEGNFIAISSTITRTNMYMYKVKQNSTAKLYRVVQIGFCPMEIAFILRNGEKIDQIGRAHV